MFLAAVAPGDPSRSGKGFYLFTGWYGVQRFAWEFLKPYPTVIGPFNVFHLVSIALIVYAPHASPRAMILPPPKRHIFYGQTTSLCETCLELVPAKIMIEDDDVFYLKRCPEHGVQKTLIAERCRLLQALQGLAEARRPARSAFQSRTNYGCPYDCGLCPDHEQHSCLALDGDQRDLQPDLPGLLRRIRARAQRPTARWPRSRRMLDALVASEGEPDLRADQRRRADHPSADSARSCALAEARPIRHLMLNTNGVRIAARAGLRRRLWRSSGRASRSICSSIRCSDEALENMRGADLRGVREPRLANLEKAGHFDHPGGGGEERRQRPGDRARSSAMRWTTTCVRGVTFQPVQDAGRNLGFDKNRDRTMLTDIRRVIAETRASSPRTT